MDLCFYPAYNYLESDVSFAARHYPLYSQSHLKHSASQIYPWILLVWCGVYPMHGDRDGRGHPFSVPATWTYLYRVVLWAIRRWCFIPSSSSIKSIKSFHDHPMCGNPKWRKF